MRITDNIEEITMRSPIVPYAWRDPGFLAIVFAVISVTCTVIGHGGEFIMWLLK